MPEFTDPFNSVTPKNKLSDMELARSIRLNIAAELEAINLYEAHAEATDHPLAKKVLLDIANEEREHVGEFQKLLRLLVDDEDQLLANGEEEVEEMAEAVGDYPKLKMAKATEIGEATEEELERQSGEGSDDEDSEAPSVGNLRK